MSKALNIKVGRERLYQILKTPVVTEKSTLGSEYNQFTFEVSMDATKPEIKQAVEEVFKVKVLSVNTLINKGKTRRFRGIKGKRSDRKRAMVRLAEGSSIDVASGL